MLDIYQLNLAGLLVACGALFASSSTDKPVKKDEKSAKQQKKEKYQQGSQWAFYVVYALVMGSDWLQVNQYQSVN